MKLRLIGLSLVAVFAFSVVASASAHEFIASKTGTLKGTGGAQVFKTSAGNVECASLTASGQVTALKAASQNVSVAYEKCEAFGSKVTISTAEYAFNAAETVGVIGKAIVVTDATGKCSVLVSFGGANATLKTVKYKNVGKGITTETNVAAINYTPTGGVCGTAKLNTNGTYTGSATTEVVGGTLKWE